MFFRGDFVVIKNSELYKGKLGKIENYDGSMYYNINLCSIKKTIKCLESQIEKANKNDIKKHIVLLKLYGDITLKLKDQNLKPSYECLSGNQHFGGLYCLGKYYPQKSFPLLHEKDYLSRAIIDLKSPNNQISEKIYIIFINFINFFNSLKKIINKVDFIVMMPSMYYYNHIEPWGTKLCNKLKKEDISNFVYIAQSKQKKLKWYKRMNPWQRAKNIEGAFIIDNENENLPLLSDKICLILDDVCTTGNQINELTNTLVKAGIKETYAFVIGKTKTDFILL